MRWALALLLVGYCWAGHLSEVCGRCQEANCIAEATICMEKHTKLVPIEPLPTRPVSNWPGQYNPVFSHFVAGIVVVGVEVVLLWTVASMFVGQTERSLDKLVAPAAPQRLTCCLGGVLAAAGWFYFLVSFAINWNFISYLMLSGFALVGPAIVAAYRMPHGEVRRAQLIRRVLLGGWMVGAITLVMFPNVTTLPSQVVRRLNPSMEVLTPEEPLVLQLRDELFSEISPAVFQKLSFQAKMLYVDQFIFRKVEWKSDYSQYLMVGLLTTPKEVLTRMAGDCQGQAATTASLLLSMGFRAWVVETPFHWWTHAEDPDTGAYFDLNFHGSAGNEGSVKPQPICQVYTQPKAACTDCWTVLAHNNDPTLYAASPTVGFAVAWTGAHIFVRSNLTLPDANYVQLTVFSVAIAAGEAVYSSFLHADWTNLRKRFLVALFFGGLPAMLGTAFWATVYYPVSLMHLGGVAVFSQLYVSSIGKDSPSL